MENFRNIVGAEEITVTDSGLSNSASSSSPPEKKTVKGTTFLLQIDINTVAKYYFFSSTLIYHYRQSVRPRWLDMGQVHFLRLLHGPRRKRKKGTRLVGAFRFLDKDENEYEI